MVRAIVKSLRPTALLPDLVVRAAFALLGRCGRAFEGVSARLLAVLLVLEKRTMLSPQRLKKLYQVCTAESLPSGSFVECGVARGGGVAMMTLAAAGKRSVWGFDSFGEMPPLTADDEGDGEVWVGYQCSGAEGKQEAVRTTRRFNLDSSDTHLIAGWFEDTLQQHLDQLKPIAILRLDADWYAATRYCLECCYDHVAPGGVVLIDDYNAFVGCRKAVDEFRSEHNIASPLIATEGSNEVCWYKEEDTAHARRAA